MQCSECRESCAAAGGLCGRAVDQASIEAGHEAGFDAVAAQNAHRRDAHPMRLEGAVWRCREGHALEAEPSDVMVANGARRML